jgi:mannose-1-phosphate guanylyltransferase/mannose-6-phosphate isomerase
MFMFKPGVFIEELSLFDSGMVSLVELSIKNASSDLDFFRLNSDSFNQINGESIDYAVMEKTDKAVVIPLNTNWYDIGSWSALHEISEKDESNNVIKGDVFSEQTSNSYIYASNKIIATLGIDNLVIIDTPDAILVAGKDKSQDLKVITERLIQENRCEQKLHRKVYRPWGWYDSLESGSNFQVKRLHIEPGAKLSLQSHQKRAEHWVVIKGEALVTCNDKIFILSENQSTYIPKNSKHRIENCKDDELEVIEVQSGKYFGEDDIVRFDDYYGRN